MRRGDFFWDYVDASGGPEACWPWLRYRTRNGYGSVWRDGGTMPAHRWALILTAGPPPMDKPMALHSCDNRPCCNPAHLRWGTRADNTHDAWTRGRANGNGLPPLALTVIATFEVGREIRALVEEARGGQSISDYVREAILATDLRGPK